MNMVAVQEKKSQKENYCDLVLFPYYLWQINKEERKRFSNLMMGFLTEFKNVNIKLEYMDFINETIDEIIFMDYSEVRISPEFQNNMYILGKQFLKYFDREYKNSDKGNIYEIIKNVNDDYALHEIFPYATDLDLAICHGIGYIMEYGEKF